MIHYRLRLVLYSQKNTLSLFGREFVLPSIYLISPINGKKGLNSDNGSADIPPPTGSLMTKMHWPYASSEIHAAEAWTDPGEPPHFWRLVITRIRTPWTIQQVYWWQTLIGAPAAGSDRSATLGCHALPIQVGKKWLVRSRWEIALVMFYFRFHLKGKKRGLTGTLPPPLFLLFSSLQRIVLFEGIYFCHSYHYVLKCRGCSSDCWDPL